MDFRLARHSLTAGAFALAVSSIIATRVFKQFSIAEVLAVAAFACGLASWLADRSTDRLITSGAALGLGGLCLKGIFVLLGIGAEQHDMETHQTTASNPLLIHIHHLFFNIGFLLYFAAAIRLGIGKLSTGKKQ